MPKKLKKAKAKKVSVEMDSKLVPLGSKVGITEMQLVFCETSGRRKLQSKVILRADVMLVDMGGTFPVVFVQIAESIAKGIVSASVGNLRSVRGTSS